jgi:hypothetical protein
LLFIWRCNYLGIQLFIACLLAEPEKYNI